MKDLASRYLRSAVDFGANDLYFLPTGQDYQVFFRNSHQRKWIEALSKEEGNALISHFKFVAGMNVGEKRRIQQGAVDYEFEEISKRLRLSTVGDHQGQESLVIRILSDSKSLKKLSFWYDDLSYLKDFIGRRGLYLFSGPVGSGKTSLMYQIAKSYFSKKQVVTIEDPVEIIDDGFLQLSRNEIIGNSYDELLKLSLRHMPDLVIVGEIRDLITARAVVRASLTGYTVFSTIHARSIPGVYIRLIELGASEIELRNTLNGIIYQRLLAGKGMIDVAKENYQKHSAERWNEKVEKLVEAGYLSVFEGKNETIKSE